MCQVLKYVPAAYSGPASGGIYLQRVASNDTSKMFTTRQDLGLRRMHALSRDDGSSLVTQELAGLQVADGVIRPQQLSLPGLKWKATPPRFPECRALQSYVDIQFVSFNQLTCPMTTYIWD